MKPEEAVTFKGLCVEVKPSSDPIKSLDGALRKLKRMIKDDELMLRLNEKSHFTKPSAVKRDKKSKAKARQRHETRRNMA